MPQKGLAKGKACSFLSIYKKINLSIDYSIQHAQLPMGNYKILEKAKKNKRENTVIRTRLKYDQMLKRKYKIYG